MPILNLAKPFNHEGGTQDKMSACLNILLCVAGVMKAYLYYVPDVSSGYNIKVQQPDKGTSLFNGISLYSQAKQVKSLDSFSNIKKDTH